MLAKDGAGQTVKVARGLHDLSEMEGVKVYFKCFVYFPFLCISLDTNLPHGFETWTEHIRQGCSPRPAEKQAAPPREKQALPREIDKTRGAQRGKTDCRFH